MSALARTLLLLLTATLATQAAPRLESDKSEEERMVRGAIHAGEKLMRLVPENYRRTDSAATAAAQEKLALARLEGGILESMGVTTDMATVIAYARHSRLGNARHLALFDSAANYLAPPDRVRYYNARVAIDIGFLESCGDPDTGEVWVMRIARSQYQATAAGADPREGTRLIAELRQKHALYRPSEDEYTCKMYQARARYVVAQVKLLGQSGETRDACALAVRAAGEVPPAVNLNPGAWGRASDAELARQFENRLLTPLQRSATACADDIRLAACDAWWNNTPLVLSVLARVRTPSKDAFELFERVAATPALARNRALAQAELALWKKAGKLAQFKQDHPQRYRLAAGSRKK